MLLTPRSEFDGDKNGDDWGSTLDASCGSAAQEYNSSGRGVSPLPTLVVAGLHLVMCCARCPVNGARCEAAM